MDELIQKYLKAAQKVAEKASEKVIVLVTAEIGMHNGYTLTSYPCDFRIEVSDAMNWRWEADKAIQDKLNPDQAEWLSGLWLERIWAGKSRWDVMEYEDRTY